MSDKAPEAFRTIGEVADQLRTPAHVLRFWESKFSQVKPVKRAGGRRYYRPADVALLAGIKQLLHDDGMTIRGVQKLLREQGPRHVAGLANGGAPTPAANGAAPLVPSPDPVAEPVEALSESPPPVRGQETAAEAPGADEREPASETAELDTVPPKAPVAAPQPEPLSNDVAEPEADTPPPASGDTPPAEAPVAQPEAAASTHAAAPDNAGPRPVARLRAATGVDPARAKALLERCAALRARLRSAAGAGT